MLSVLSAPGASRDPCCIHRRQDGRNYRRSHRFIARSESAYQRRASWDHCKIHLGARRQFHLLDDGCGHRRQGGESRPILLENLYEEVHDSHPHMLRKFAIAANAFPTDKDALAVHDELTRVRLFVGKLSAVKSVLMMGFFEGFIQRFMPYLADLAARQGSTELEYTEVHGVCDIEHTEGLFKVLAAEIALTPPEPNADLFEGVTLLRTLIERIIRPQAEPLAP